jgi:hypothetical protein
VVNIRKRVPNADNLRPVIRKIQNLPRHAIRYVNPPYTSAQHHPRAFRHYIPLPDSIMPHHWRDDYVTAADLKLGFKDKGLFASDGDDHTDLESIQQQHSKTLQAATCGLYVAPSTIPNAGNGLFLGVNVPAADIHVVS